MSMPPCRRCIAAEYRAKHVPRQYLHPTEYSRPFQQVRVTSARRRNATAVSGFERAHPRFSVRSRPFLETINDIQEQTTLLMFGRARDKPQLGRRRKKNIHTLKCHTPIMCRIDQPLRRPFQRSLATTISQSVDDVFDHLTLVFFLSLSLLLFFELFSEPPASSLADSSVTASRKRGNASISHITSNAVLGSFAFKESAKIWAHGVNMDEAGKQHDDGTPNDEAQVNGTPLDLDSTMLKAD